MIISLTYNIQYIQHTIQYIQYIQIKKNEII